MGIGPQNLGAMGMSSSSHGCGSPLNKNKDKASSEAKAAARKVAKGRKKYAKADEASSQGFKETRKSKRLNKAGDRKTDKGRAIADKLSPEQAAKSAKIFTERINKQDKKSPPLTKKDTCWDGYKAQGQKKSPSGKKTSSGKAKMVNNCVKI